MSTTVTYKGATLTTVDNATVTLNTAGKYCEDDFTLTDVSGGGGVQTGAVTIAGELYYTDADMQYQHGVGLSLVGQQLPLNTLVVRNGPAEPGTTVSGVQQVYKYSSVYVFKVTG